MAGFRGGQGEDSIQTTVSNTSTRMVMREIAGMPGLLEILRSSYMIHLRTYWYDRTVHGVIFPPGLCHFIVIVLQHDSSEIGLPWHCWP